MRLRQWDVLGAMKTIKDVMQLLGGRVVRCLYVYVVYVCMSMPLRFHRPFKVFIFYNPGERN